MGSVRLYGSTSGYLELQAPAVAPDAVLTLPSDSVQPGLVHLHTETFSAVSSVSIDNVFSAEYDSYRILMTHTATLSAELRLRLRVGGADNTASTYNSQLLEATNTSISAAKVSPASYSYVQFLDGASAKNAVQIELYDPAKLSPTGLQVTADRGISGSTILMILANGHSGSIAFDGFTIYPSSGTITGTLRIYGYRNA